MSIVVKINSTDRSANVVWPTLRVEQNLTSQVDNCRFRIRYDGAGQAVRPAVDDEIRVEDDGDAVFGGIVTRVSQTVVGPALVQYDVQAVSFERKLDRYLAVTSIEDESLLFVINSLFNGFVNVRKLVLATFEDDEVWSDESGSSAADTDNYAFGSQGRKLTVTAGNTTATRQDVALDLTAFDDGNAADTDDLVTFFVRVSDANNCDSLRLRLCVQDGGTYTDYFEHEITTGIVSGWNIIKVAKSAFTSVGSPSWSGINSVQVAATANAEGGFTATFDDVRMIDDAGFTLTGLASVESSVKYVAFNYEPVSECLRQVAKLIGYEWYIDADRDLKFYPPATVAAPFGLTDTSGNFVFDSLEIKNDISSLRNQIFVRGGEEVGEPLTEDISEQANGNNVIFNLGYRYTDLSATLNGAPLDVGIDFIDDITAHDCLFNFQEKTLRFNAAPAGGDAIIVTAKPYIPIIVKKRDAASIAEFGVFEYCIVDKTIKTREGARQRAQADLIAYRAQLDEGGFTTYTSGLRAGQRINIASTVRGIDTNFVINRLTLSMRTPEAAQYEATIVTTRTYGIIEFLLGLLRQDAKGIEIGEDEILDLVETVEETVTASDAVTIESAITNDETVQASEASMAAVDSPPTWVAGPYQPAAILPTDNKRPAFADRDCQVT